MDAEFALIRRLNFETRKLTHKLKIPKENYITSVLRKLNTNMGALCYDPNNKTDSSVYLKYLKENIITSIF